METNNSNEFQYPPMEKVIGEVKDVQILMAGHPFFLVEIDFKHIMCAKDGIEVEGVPTEYNQFREWYAANLPVTAVLNPLTERYGASLKSEFFKKH